MSHSYFVTKPLSKNKRSVIKQLQSKNYSRYDIHWILLLCHLKIVNYIFLVFWRMYITTKNSANHFSHDTYIYLLISIDWQQEKYIRKKIKNHFIWCENLILLSLKENSIIRFIFCFYLVGSKGYNPKLTGKNH